MRAAVFRAAGRLELDRVPLPEPGPGEVRLAVAACGVCGSDLHLLETGPVVPGVIPGHELVGHVHALGEGVDGVEPGSPMAVEPLHSCGRCRFCRAGNHAICRGAELYGIHRNGGFADYVVVPAQRLFPVAPDLPPAIAALAEPMAVVVHGLRRGGLEPGQRVLVLGAGSLGLLAVVAARALGAGEVWISARYDHQAERALGLGATRVLREVESTGPALRALGREQDIDLVVESVGGRADTLRLAAEAARPGGTLAVLGFFLTDVPLPGALCFAKELTLAWSNCYAHPHAGADFEAAIALLAAQRSALSGITTHQLPLAELPRALALAAGRRAGAVKVTLLP